MSRRPKRRLSEEEPDLQDDIHRIIAKHVRRQTLNSTLETILEDSAKKNFLLQLMAAHINMLRERSHNLAHAQITIYDKALLSLTLSGHDTSQHSALGLFAEEILGILTPESFLPRLGAYHMPFANEAAEFEGRQDERHGPMPLDFSSSKPDTFANATDIVSAIDDQNNITASADAAVEKLVATLETAKAEYQATRHLSPKERAPAAVFLRDTCENVMMFLRGTETDPRLMEEIETVCAMATSDVMMLRDGKKRKFDLTPKDLRSGAPPTRVNNDNEQMETKQIPKHVRQQYRNKSPRRGRFEKKLEYRNKSNNANRFEYHERQHSQGSPQSSEESHNIREVRHAIRKGRRVWRQANPEARRPHFYNRDVDTYHPGG